MSEENKRKKFKVQVKFYTTYNVVVEAEDDQDAERYAYNLGEGDMSGDPDDYGVDDVDVFEELDEDDDSEAIVWNTETE